MGQSSRVRAIAIHTGTAARQVCVAKEGIRSKADGDRVIAEVGRSGCERVGNGLRWVWVVEDLGGKEGQFPQPQRRGMYSVLTGLCLQG
jgi:hypothetical protein